MEKEKKEFDELIFVKRLAWCLALANPLQTSCLYCLHRFQGITVIVQRLASWMGPSWVLPWLLCFENISLSSWTLLSLGPATGQSYFLWRKFRSPSSSVEVWRKVPAWHSCFTIWASYSLWQRSGASVDLFLNSLGLDWISSRPPEGMTLHLDVAHLNLLISEDLESCLAGSFFL